MILLYTLKYAVIRIILYYCNFLRFGIIIENLDYAWDEVLTVLSSRVFENSMRLKI